MSKVINPIFSMDGVTGINLNKDSKELTVDYVFNQLCEHGKVGNISSNWLIDHYNELLKWADEEGVQLKFDYGENFNHANRIYLRKVKND